MNNTCPTNLIDVPIEMFFRSVPMRCPKWKNLHKKAVRKKQDLHELLWYLKHAFILNLL